MSVLDEFDQLLVVLVATRNPLNMGAAARAMSNFGFLRLRVVNPYDPSFREARSAVGASAVMAEAEQFKSVAEAVADCTLVVGTTAAGKRELQHPLRDLEEGAPLIRERMRSGRVALLFGSEKTGLSSKDLSHCHWLMHIPTRQEHLSMNLGQAVAVCLYEIARGCRIAAEQTEALEKYASVDEVERVTGVLLEALDSSGYIGGSVPVDVEERVRRLVRRMDMRSQDPEVWLGMLRQIVWKLRSGAQ
ncbi:MAG TPA: RNA methyltransferase [Acidisarcina sp.]|nr:RNA methyltransferase [Acidisarcina sp.]